MQRKWAALDRIEMFHYFCTNITTEAAQVAGLSKAKQSQPDLKFHVGTQLGH